MIKLETRSYFGPFLGNPVTEVDTPEGSQGKLHRLSVETLSTERVSTNFNVSIGPSNYSVPQTPKLRETGDEKIERH